MVIVRVPVDTAVAARAGSDQPIPPPDRLNLSLLPLTCFPRRLRSILLARITVLALLLLNLLVVSLAAIVPQRIGTSNHEFERWQEEHLTWIPLLDRFGLDHIFSTPWFAILLTLTLVALLCSLMSQIRAAWHQTFTLGAREGKGPWQHFSIPYEVVGHLLRRSGYWQIKADERQIRYLKNPWGYWGNPMLHGGMVVTLTAALLMALTQQRGLLQLNEGEVHGADEAWTYSEHGPFAPAISFPEAIQLVYLLPEFWAGSDELKGLSCGVRFVAPGQGRESRLTLSSDTVVTRLGFRIYQGVGFGYSFTVELSPTTGERQTLRLAIQQPERKGMAGYGNFRIHGVPYVLKAKYLLDHASAGERQGVNTLALRLADGAQALGELTLAPGGSGKLGPYQVRLLEVRRWGSMVITRLRGLVGVFVGFALIIVGSSLIYLFPVREVLLVREGDGVLLCWRPGRFALFHQNEHERLLQGLRAWNPS